MSRRACGVIGVVAMVLAILFSWMSTPSSVLTPRALHAAPNVRSVPAQSVPSKDTSLDVSTNDSAYEQLDGEQDAEANLERAILQAVTMYDELNDPPAAVVIECYKVPDPDADPAILPTIIVFNMTYCPSGATVSHAWDVLETEDGELFLQVAQDILGE